VRAAEVSCMLMPAAPMQHVVNTLWAAAVLGHKPHGPWARAFWKKVGLARAGGAPLAGKVPATWLKVLAEVEGLLSAEARLLRVASCGATAASLRTRLGSKVLAVAGEGRQAAL